MSNQKEMTPEVTCSGCGRRVRCVRVADGTVYRPFAWAFTDPETPLVGLCAGCQAATDTDTWPQAIMPPR